MKRWILGFFLVSIVILSCISVCYGYDDTYPHSSVCPDKEQALLPGDYYYNGKDVQCWIDGGNGFCQCNCTAYVAWKLQEQGLSFTNSFRDVHWGNGGKWDDAAREVGVGVDQIPLPGDAAYWNTLGGVGHEAFVERVYFDKNGKPVSIDVSQYNIIHEDWSWKNIPLDSNGKPDGFIHILLYEFGVMFYVDNLEMFSGGTWDAPPFSNQTSNEANWLISQLSNYRNVTISKEQAQRASIYFNEPGLGGGNIIPIIRNSNVKIKTVKLSDAEDKAIGHVLEKEPDSRYNIHIAIENKGNKKAEDLEIRYYISDDKTFGDGDDKYLASDWISFLASGDIVLDRKIKDKNGDPLKAPKEVGEYYVYAVVIVHGDSTSNISDSDDKDEYGNLTVKAYVPPPPPIVRTLKITSPDGGTWRTDKEYSIKWSSDNLSKSSHVKVEFSLNSGSSWIIVDSYAVNDGSKKIKLKNFGVKKDTDKARVRVTSIEYPKVSDTAKFKIDYKK